MLAGGPAWTWMRAFAVWILGCQRSHVVLGDIAPCSTPCGSTSFHDASGDYQFDGTNFSNLSLEQCAVCAWRHGPLPCEHPAKTIATQAGGRLLCCAVLEGFCEVSSADERPFSGTDGNGLAHWVTSQSSWVSEKIISDVVELLEAVIQQVHRSNETIVWWAAATTEFFWFQSDHVVVFLWAVCDWRTWLGITILSLAFYKKFRAQIQSVVVDGSQNPLDALSQWERWCERSRLRGEDYWPLVMPPGAIRRMAADRVEMFGGLKDKMHLLVAKGSRVKNRVSNRFQRKNVGSSRDEGEKEESGTLSRHSLSQTVTEGSAEPVASISEKRIISPLQNAGARTRSGCRRTRFEIHPELLDSSATPLLCFVNPASGGKQGDHVMRTLSQLLNPMQVFNLRQCRPAEILSWFLKGFGPKLRVLVAGGDGTVGWVFSIFDELAANNELPCRPSVAILPLGTGNDMARVMGWGGGYSGGCMKAILSAVSNATPTCLDRWQADLTLSSSVERHPAFFHAKGKSRVNFTNYFGVGVDAEVVNNFHELRNHRPQLFWSRWVNRLHYTWMGILSSARRSCKRLHKHLTVTCDGQLYELDDDVEGVIISNIASYAGGVTLWTNEKDSPVTSQQDGLLDVVLVKGSDHLGWIQLRMDKAVKLCQAHRVDITTRVPLPMHADGEPWIQPPSRLAIAAKGSQEVLLKRNASNGEAMLASVLDWAVGENAITIQQKQILVQEMSKRAEAKSSQNHTRHKRVLSGTFAGFFGA